ncbi:3-carboxy-cis,cis-muconate cycloisomerase [Roseobacter sp. HKCCA0434]|uniref:3-carboxy-cis,cis-muconate cycloisomerase n=1 Tax=Roseobacter sp. HKCCA0434 TaxID=3079297 RepID=UPI002905B997|nr:3-carboxy-cis,cis-muconate cycloisomerase [Roseobacter sp. HKCCA0434]
MSPVFDHPWLGALFGDAEVAALWSAEAQLAHYIRFETALAHALDAAGLVAPGSGSRVGEVLAAVDLDPTALAAATARDGLPIPELVRTLRAAVGADLADAVHTGATSQDVLDTALSLTLRAQSDLFVARLRALDAQLAELSATQGDRALMGRTRMQAALPIRVRDRVEAWRRPLIDLAEELLARRDRVARLQLGGAVGTRASFGAAGHMVAAEMARRLDLSDGPCWHSDRGAVADHGALLSRIGGALGKMGQDIALMAQQGVDAISLSGGGGSSAMPHKSNPVLAELLVTLARYDAGQLSGLHHALVHEQERSGAAWMLEWMILPQMSVATGRALGAAQELLTRIETIGDAAAG